MEILRRADRRVLVFGLAAWLAIYAVGAFWSLEGVETTLESEANQIASLQAAEGASIEFNGRDGYLSVMSGTENAEQIASDIADIQGVRDVEIAVLDDAVLDDAVPDGATIDGAAVDSAETDPVDADELESQAAADSPAAFDMQWTPEWVKAGGALPAELSTEFSALLGTDDLLESDESVNLDHDIEEALRSRIAPLIGGEIPEGTLHVADNHMTLTGVVADADARQALMSELEDIEGLTVELSEPADEADDAGDTDDALPADEAAAAQGALDRLLDLGRIEFVSGTATPTPETETVIDEVASTLNEFPEVRIVISGHTDASGDDGENQVLSEQRANAVVEGLVARGVAPERLRALGLGEAQPIDSNDTAEGQQRNRRVEIDVEETA